MDEQEKFDRRFVSIRTRFIRAQITAGYAFLGIAKRDRHGAGITDARSAYHAAVAELVRLDQDLDTDSIRSLVVLLTGLAREIALWDDILG